MNDLPVAAAVWGWSMTARDANKLGSVIGGRFELDSLEMVTEKRMLSKLVSIYKLSTTCCLKRVSSQKLRSPRCCPRQHRL